MQNKIPKIIHYCWFGKAEKSPEILQCIATWKKMHPDFEIREWNESNSPKHPIVVKNLKDKLWAFASDYVRLYAIYHHGGIYLDTDFLLTKSLASLLNQSCFVAFQYKEKSPFWITNGVCGGIKKHHFFERCLQLLEHHGHSKLNSYISPKLTSDVINNISSSYTYGTQMIDDIHILDADSFYHYQRDDVTTNSIDHLIKKLPSHAYGIHLYEGSWINDSNNWNRYERVILFLKKIRTKIQLLLNKN